MSKKSQKKQTAFVLEPDGFSIHTFELSRRLTGHEFRKLKENLYDLQHERGGKNDVYRESEGIYRCRLFSEHGIRLCLKASDSGGYEQHRLHIVVNPRQLIDPEAGYLGIFPPDKKSLKKLRISFEELFKETKIPDNINDYELRRLDLCVNIRCGMKKIFRELVRVLRKLPTPKKYKRVFYKHKEKTRANKYNKHYLRFACGTHELVIYDKTYHLVESGLAVDYQSLPEGVLRIEMHCGRDYIRTLQKKQSIETTMDMIKWMVEHSEQQITKKFGQCFRTGMFCQMDEIKRRIKDSSFHKEKKENMLKLSRRMQRKQNLDKELEAMRRDNVDTDELMEAFEKIGTNPVPLWQNFIAPCLPGPVELLQGVSGGELPVEYIKVKN